ncbi:MAG: universal stress protein [Cellvibrionales bacterium]|nr:MAG: universal stress protein [Cellvibrionales bacterium]
MSDQNGFKYENILVVVDPTREEQPALERALVSSQLDIHPKIHVFIGVDLASTENSAENPKLYKSAHELLELLHPLDEKGVDYTTEICWAPQWHEAILRSAKNNKVDMIIVPDYSGEEGTSRGLGGLRHRLSDPKWGLLRNAIRPVLLVRPNTSRKRSTILAAVKTQTVKTEYNTLNDKIISRGKWLASLYGADFHVVNAYPDSLNFPDRGQLRRITDMDSSKVHVKLGNPEDVITETAHEIDADIVIIGTLARKGVLAAMRGNTSEKVIGKLTQDIFTLNSDPWEHIRNSEG